MLCLDWRDICNGQQNCMDGLDEENCDLLEFNECENDEYRCTDGMCIAEEYWLDGSLDCMDWTDETFALAGVTCVIYPWPIYCDDHKCPINYWSCGDGQCIYYFKRHIYQTELRDSQMCYSMREFSYMCELASDESYWTKPDGLCTEWGYNDTSLILSSNLEKCIYYIRCALSKGAEIQCPCNGINCNTLMQDVCEPGNAYTYPYRGIIWPWIKQYYSWEQTWNDKTPDLTFFVGTTCWNDSFTFSGRPYAFYDICPNSSICFSQYRIADGIPDCVYKEDEDSRAVEERNYCHNIQKHRFQCSSEQMTCLPLNSLTQIQNFGRTCVNKYDVKMKGEGQYLDSMLCADTISFSDCNLLRYYIGNSSIPNSNFTNTNVESNSGQRSLGVTPFHYYCDTFWDEQPLHDDENTTNCQSWICPEEFFRCSTGQCILVDWVCDGEWDCSDASDEFDLPEQWINHNEHLSNQLNDRKKLCQENYAALPFRGLCDLDHEYPCYRSTVSNPLDINKYPPCINHVQIGDGIEDCYGGIDEKNTFKDCDGNMLGYTLKCGNKCAGFLQKCDKDTVCSTSVLCSYKNPEIEIQLSYLCNRGFPLWSPDTMSYRCLCPPTFYGLQCQFFSDRISVITHLDLPTFPVNSSARLVTVAASLYFRNVVMDHHIFHVNPLLETNKPIKHRFYLLYSRSIEFLNHKKSRYFNRTDILHDHPYDVYFDIFVLTENATEQIGFSYHPIYFDFLPAFRLATVLKFPSWISNSTLNPCNSNPCNANAFCNPVLNKKPGYYCSCKSGYSGSNCENYHTECSIYCSSDSICRPNYRGVIANTQHPLCICPFGYFGPRCHLRNDACKSNPCGLNATCYPSYDPSGENNVICVCSEHFYGDRCQNEKLIIHIQVNMTALITVSVTQFYDHFKPFNTLVLSHQQVTHGLPQIIRYDNDRDEFPLMALLKIYQQLSNPRYFIVYAQWLTESVNITSTPVECPHVLDIFSQGNIFLQ
ncbi:unnamed protein product [Adineta steineri]|uniref:EGF-like domain-containing protein n=1 Tax=Adineta steineri TaxID=433720 RepID=A0A813RTC1_9BILA|nr:unnamed protein product [Adineta steineri]CAF4080688.1 unnamed protein product [Adineta steineri]